MVCYSIWKCGLSPQGLVTLLKLWLHTLPCHTLSSRHGLSSTCSHPSLLSFRGPAARILGTQVHDIFHTARATCTFSNVVGGMLCPGLAVEGAIVTILPSGHQMFSFSGCKGSLAGSLLGLWSSVFYRSCRMLWCSEFWPTSCLDVCGRVFMCYICSKWLHGFNQPGDAIYLTILLVTAPTE